MSMYKFILSILVINILGVVSYGQGTIKKTEDAQVIKVDTDKNSYMLQNGDSNILTTQNKQKIKRSPSDCKIEVIKELKDNIDQLTEQHILTFLECFNKTCELNVEFSQAANYHLFTLLQHEPKMAFKVISENDHLSKKHIYKNLRNPVNDQIDIQLTRKKVNEVNGYETIKESILMAIPNS